MSKNSCDFCGGKFGLTRHYHAFSAFCRKECKEKFLERRDREIREQRRWLEFLARPT